MTRRVQCGRARRFVCDFSVRLCVCRCWVVGDRTFVCEFINKASVWVRVQNATRARFDRPPLLDQNVFTRHVLPITPAARRHRRGGSQRRRGGSQHRRCSGGGAPPLSLSIPVFLSPALPLPLSLSPLSPLPRFSHSLSPSASLSSVAPFPEDVASESTPGRWRRRRCGGGGGGSDSSGCRVLRRP